jgi:hypothetical protein
MRVLHGALFGKVGQGLAPRRVGNDLLESHVQIAVALRHPACA